MPDPLRALLAQALDSVRYQMDGLESGRLTVDDWQQGMAQDMLTYHIAAYLTGTGSTSADALDDAARKTLASVVGAQVDYLNAFADAIDAADVDPDQFARWRAQAALYAGSTKQSYWRGAAGVDLPCYPGGCEECYGNCRCSVEVRDDGVWWICSDDDRSCDACRERGQTWTPYGG